MNNGYYNVQDSFLEATRVAKKYIKGQRCVIGFTTDTEVCVNGATYKKIRGIDIDAKTNSFTLSTKKENIKIKVDPFTLSVITYVGGVVAIQTK